MSELKAPPTRFRVEERGRQLVVIDTLTGESHISTSAALSKKFTQSAAKQAVTQNRQPPQMAGVSEDFLLRSARFFTQNKVDRRGHLVLKTLRFYDERAPRLLALEPRMARHYALFALIQAGALGLIFLYVLATGLFAAIFISIILAIVMRPISMGVMKAITAKAELAAF